ncbi:MAG: VOC family protein [Flavobacteriales bacterium]|nr:VOC family protein [Flavobacteriales bacterium]
MYKRINGLQHIGVAVSNMDHSLKYYRKFFGLDIPFFDSVQPAPLMDVYTRNKTIVKRASMIMNLQGGCAIEVIRPTSFEPVGPKHPVKMGDLGIFITQVKCRDINRSWEFCKNENAERVTAIQKDPDGRDTFYIEDPDGNVWQYLQGDSWYTRNNHHSGGVIGCTTGVSNMEKALKLYADVLGFDEIVYDKTGTFEDWNELRSGKEKYRRVLLTQKAQPGGGFARVTGKTYIELVQALDRKADFIFEDRIWGDTGFAHIGFDVKGMKALGEDLKKAGYPFTCDSNDALSMGTTKVHCTYIHDDDRTLIEMIEVYKVPIMEKWGIFLNVEKRDPLKPLPDFMLKALRFSRVRD